MVEKELVHIKDRIDQLASSLSQFQFTQRAGNTDAESLHHTNAKLELMGLDELQSVQDDLVMKLGKTSTLI